MSSPPSATSLGDAPGIVIRRAAPRDAEAIEALVKRLEAKGFDVTRAALD